MLHAEQLRAGKIVTLRSMTMLMNCSGICLNIDSKNRSRTNFKAVLYWYWCVNKHHDLAKYYRNFKLSIKKTRLS